jgi:hypothetical protein
MRAAAAIRQSRPWGCYLSKGRDQESLQERLARALDAGRRARFAKANRLAAADVERRGGTAHFNGDWLRGVSVGDGYRRVEVALVDSHGRGVFRKGTPEKDVDVVIFTDCAGQFWVVTGDEMRAALSAIAFDAEMSTAVANRANLNEAPEPMRRTRA